MKAALFCTLLCLSMACSVEDPVEERTDATPQRVIAFAPSIVEFLYEMGLEDRIVGVSAYCTFPPEAVEHPVMGHANEPDQEQILGARPDLILGIGQALQMKEMAARLEIPAESLPLDSLDDIVQAPRTIGELLGEEAAGTALSRAIRQDLDAVAVDPAERPSVLIVIGRADKEVFTTGRGTFLTEIVDLAGGRSLTADREQPWFQLDWESVLSLQPDVILVFHSFDDVSVPQITELVAGWQRFDSLPAVRNDRVHVLTGTHVLKSGPRIARAARDVAMALHGSHE